MIAIHLLHALLGIATTAAPQEPPRELATAVEAVVLHPEGARVIRRSAPLAEGGWLRVSGLPASLDPAHLRARLSGGEVRSLELRQRRQRVLPEARVEALRAAVADKRAELAELAGEKAVLARLERFLRGLVEPAPRSRESEERPRLAHAEARARFERAGEILAAELEGRLASQRALALREAALARELAELEAELGHFERDPGVRLYDLWLELTAPPGGEGRLEIEYLVSGCGWSPEYELRTRGDAREVLLLFRARLWQRTGEDWREAELSLSTAQPRRGAQGVDPEPRWIDLLRPGASGGAARHARLALREEKSLDDGEEALDSLARVAASGLSLRYELPGRQSIPSRPEPSVVLVGEARLAVEPEQVCAPALSATVWLRGRARNTSPYALLPGPASVFFGADFLGQAEIGPVQRGEELLLHLGALPGLRATRSEIRDEHSGPGFLGSRSSRQQAFRVRVENHGSPVAEADGSAVVFVREALPRSTDDRVEVKLSRSNPKPSDDPRWKAEREELSIHTWRLVVPRGKSAELEVQVEILYPKSAELWIR